RIVVGTDGIRRTELVTSVAADKLRSTQPLLPLGQLRHEVASLLLASPAVPARKDQRAALAPLLDAFFDGLGTTAQDVLSAHLARAAARLIQLVEQEQRRFMAKPRYEEVVEVREFRPGRSTDKLVSQDRFGAFSKTVAYDGWHRSLFPIEWFDS